MPKNIEAFLVLIPENFSVAFRLILSKKQEGQPENELNFNVIEILDLSFAGTSF